jgi:hypothetical protein
VAVLRTVVRAPFLAPLRNPRRTGYSHDAAYAQRKTLAMDAETTVMLAINDALGFEIISTITEWQVDALALPFRPMN